MYWLIKAAYCGLAIPLVNSVALSFRLGVLGFHRVIDDCEVASEAGYCPAHRAGHSVPPCCRPEFRSRCTTRIEQKFGKHSSMPRRLDQSAHVPTEPFGEIASITQGQDPRSGMAPHQPGSEGHIGYCGFEVARWHEDHGALDLPALDAFQQMADGPHVECDVQWHVAAQLAKGTDDVAHEIVAVEKPGGLSWGYQ